MNAAVVTSFAEPAHSQPFEVPQTADKPGLRGAARHNRYDGRDLTDETRTGPFWYTAGVNWAGATTLIADPIARAVGGTDLSLPAGLLVSAAVDLLLMTRSSRASTAFLKAPSAAGLSSSRQS